MSDDLIVEAFERFTAGAGPSVRPLGTPAIRARATHRRRLRAVAASFIGVLLLAVQAVAFAGFGRDHGVRPPAVVPSVSPTISPTDGSVVSWPEVSGT
jgi:hypothetical protein